MEEKINILLSEIASFSEKAEKEIEAFRIKMLGKKGLVTNLFKEFKDVAPENRKRMGQKLNELKTKAQEKVDALKNSGENNVEDHSGDFDFSLPGYPKELGSRHPLSIIRSEIVEVFSRIGFTLADGPEIEDDWHNFTALNMPEAHPARDMQDTFFLQKNPDIVLRTHTSGVQIRYLENNQPPVRIIAPGRVYRCDNDATHSPAFHQIEGLYIDEKVSFADLKQTLYYFVHELFGDQTNIRFRPSFFPFTEPSAEMDIEWNKQGEKSWMEILGCGMVDPAVLKNCNIDPDKYAGFAFGMGIERIAMLKYGVNDLRLFFENDLRFLKQFRSA